jgi:large subunit ribosomal protein L10
MMVRIAKKTVIMRAIEKSDKKSLLEKMVNQPALIFTRENPFKIYKQIDRNRSKVSAKPGDVAPDQIVVNAGPTDLPPGPAISTLSSAKIPAKVEGGKIAVIRDVVVAKKGDKITPELASILNMLKLKPIEIALNVVAIWEGGMLFTKDVLAVDAEARRRAVERMKERAS